MFRKRTKKPVAKKNLRRKRSEEDDDQTNKPGGKKDNNSSSSSSSKSKSNDRNDNNANDDNDDGDVSTALAIRNTMKKQKILASLPMTTGGGGRRWRSGNGNGNGNHGDNGSNPPQSSQPAMPGSDAAAELSVLDTKHKNNMEAFIEEQMTTSVANSNRNSNRNSNSNSHRPQSVTEGEADQPSAGNDGGEIITEEDLYQQLAREITSGVVATATGEHSTQLLPPQSAQQQSAQQKQQQQQQQQRDGDQGAGGAALLGGTGIAEVVLPSTIHKPMAVPTGNRAWNSSGKYKYQHNRSSAVPEGERHKHALPDTTPKPFVRFSGKAGNSNNTHNSSSNHNNNTTSGSSDAGAAAAHTNTNRDVAGQHDPNGNGNGNGNTDPGVDATRRGFDAFRGKATSDDGPGNDSRHAGTTRTGSTGSTGTGTQQDQRWKTGQNRDDVVYKQFLKRALNARNR